MMRTAVEVAAQGALTVVLTVEADGRANLRHPHTIYVAAKEVTSDRCMRGVPVVLRRLGDGTRDDLVDELLAYHFQ